MTSLARILSALGVTCLALAGCGAPLDVQPEAESAALATGTIPRVNPMPIPKPNPNPIPLPGVGGTRTDEEWAGYVPPMITYPDYGITEMGCGGCEEHLPTGIDLERWDGHSLWGTRWGYVMPYWTYNTEARLPGDLNHGRLELIGVDGVTNTVVWNAFGAPDPTTGGIPNSLLVMAGTADPYCGGGHIGAGSFSSGKPPKDPPRPPDGTIGGCVLFCPAWAAENDVQARIAGCSTGTSQ